MPQAAALPPRERCTLQPARKRRKPILARAFSSLPLLPDNKKPPPRERSGVNRTLMPRLSSKAAGKGAGSRPDLSAWTRPNHSCGTAPDFHRLPLLTLGHPPHALIQLAWI